MQKTVFTRDVSLDDIFREIDQQHVESLRQVKKGGGVVAMPVVRQDGGLYPLVAHFHSFLALTADGEEKVTVELIDRELKPKEILLYQGQENELRKDFTFWERVKLYKGLIDAWGWTQAELAERMGKKEPFISKLLLRAERTHPDVLALYCSGKLVERSTDAISKLPLDKQVALATRAVAENWKCEKVEAAVKALLGQRVRKEAPRKFDDDGITLIVSAHLSNDEVRERIKRLDARFRKGVKFAEAPETAPIIL